MASDVVYEAIALMPLKVFVRVLQRCNSQDDQQRQRRQCWGDICESREELQNDENQEKDVGYPSELLEQILG